MVRILYECRDLDEAGGGIRRIYRHVEVLSKRGFNAFVLHHTPGFKVKWFSSDARVLYWQGDFGFDKRDVLVIPEGHTEVMRATTHLECRRVVLALNWARIFYELSESETWPKLGIRDVIAGSHYEKEFVAKTMNLVSTAIPSGIDCEMFSCSEQARDKCIAYMPRKNPDYAHVIIRVFRAMFPEFYEFRFESIDGVSHREVAETLRRSAIFLAHTFPEGLSRKMLEAMASGCIVVGFAGHGSSECMRHLENCYLVPDGDVLEVAISLGTAVRNFLDGCDGDMRRSAVNTGRSYSLAKEESRIVDYWTTFLRRIFGTDGGQ